VLAVTNQFPLPLDSGEPLRVEGLLRALAAEHDVHLLALARPATTLELVEQMAERWVIGAPEQARNAIAELAATYAVDEVMIHPVAGAYAGTDPGESPAREETLRLLVG